MKTSKHILALLTMAIVTSCGSENTSDRTPATPTPGKPLTEQKREPPVPVRGYTVVQTLPHDVHAFTQGLVVHQGRFLESTGQNGSSTLRTVNMLTGRVLKSVSLDAQYFGEGMTVLGDKAYMLTWLKQRAFVFDVKTLACVDTMMYLGEGWGLTTDGSVLYMSNGTDVISVRDPADFRLLNTLQVTINGSAQPHLNELEWINGEIWANVWRTDQIVRIDPSTGRVNSIVDLAGILPADKRPAQADVLNGIAYDSVQKAVYVTGKNWPHIFQIEVAQ